jgi:hypothetical protein
MELVLLLVSALLLIINVFERETLLIVAGSLAGIIGYYQHRRTALKKNSSSSQDKAHQYAKENENITKNKKKAEEHRKGKDDDSITTTTKTKETGISIQWWFIALIYFSVLYTTVAILVPWVITMLLLSPWQRDITLVALGFIIGAFGYGATYYDQSEIKGTRQWKTLRRARIWRLVKQCFRYEIHHYPHLVDDSAAAAATTASSRKSTKKKTAKAMNSDQHTGNSPRTTQKTKEQDSDNPILYACSPHAMCSLFAFLTFMVEEKNDDDEGPSGGYSKEGLNVKRKDDDGDNGRCAPRAAGDIGKSTRRKPWRLRYHPQQQRTYTKTRDSTVMMGVHALLTTIPVVREFVLWMGGVDARWESLAYQIEHQYRSVAVVPDGVLGMGKRLPGARQRRGFLRRVFDMTEIDVDIVPVICPNEESLCIVWDNEWSWITRVRQWCMDCPAIRYPFPTFFLGPWPHKPLIVLVGPRHCKRRGEGFKSYCKRYQQLELALWHRWYENHA